MKATLMWDINVSVKNKEELENLQVNLRAAINKLDGVENVVQADIDIEEEDEEETEEE